MSYARRTDANLTPIVKAYRKLGCSVWVSNLGPVDLVVGYGGISELVEVKDGSKPPSARRLTKAQVEFRKHWTGGIRLITSLANVETHVRQLRELHEYIWKRLI